MRVLWLIVLSSCGGPLVTLTPEGTSYRSGERVSLTLANRSLSALGYNLCFSELRAVDGGRIDDSNGTFCQAIQLQLLGGESSTGRMRALPSGLSGAHFYRTSIEDPNLQRVELDSASFDVTP